MIIQPRYPNPPEEDLLYEVPVSNENAYILCKSNNVMEFWIDGQKWFDLTEKDLKSEPYSTLPIIEEGE